MAKRLYMTSADYVAIAISPALIMALVGSLVFFLIEVLYEGQYQARLTYVFALFVFAAVLIARISIEDGRERGALFALPLGLATFVVLSKFVEHSSSFSGLINLALIAIIWWCADKLTWDCTLIDDDQDSSGEGLLQRVGIDETPGNPSPARGVTENELQAERDRERPWWQRLFVHEKDPHTPGVWVVYFSLAALPLFGIGQLWIPASDVGRRQYAFSLLFVYVAAGLALLVTTSFLGLRRYLRQRHVEMPAPMAANWVALGAVLIALVMFVALLIPRPAAEYAISQPPFTFHSPGDLSTSRWAVGNDGTQKQPGAANVTPSDEQAERTVESEQGQSPGESGDQGSKSQSSDEQSDKPQSGEQGQQSEQGQQGEQGESTRSERDEHATERKPQDRRDDQSGETGSQSPQEQTDQAEQDSGGSASQQSSGSRPFRLPELSFSLGGLSGLIKLVLYVLGGLLIAYLVWKHRHELLRAFRELIQGLRDFVARLFGKQPTAAVADEPPPPPPRKRFSDFRDPFSSGEFRRLAPEELVRYTFEAFEAWAGDRGAPRTPDRTPTELLIAALPPQTPMFTAARRMIRLYSEVAYASGQVQRSAAEELRELWRMMGEGTVREMANAQ